MCSKRVPESVWADFFVQLNGLSQFSNHRKNHCSSECSASTIQKKRITKILFRLQKRTAFFSVNFNNFLSGSPKRNRALLVAFSGDFDEAFVKKQVRSCYRNQLRNSKTTTVKRFQNSFI